MSGMDCRTAESMVTRFIDHSLSVNELEEFLDHIETCPSCYDELETYFIVHEAMQQLDEKEDGTVLDFKKLLEQEIRRSRRSIRQKRGASFYAGAYLHGSRCGLVRVCDLCYIREIKSIECEPKCNRRTET